MSTPVYTLTSQEKKKIQHWVDKFPEGKAQSAVIMALRILQDNHKWLKDEHLDAVAEYLAMPKIGVYEVASFYSMYNRQEKGKFVLKVCGSISCHLCKAHDVIGQLQEKLGVKMGETTQDGLFTLEEAECLAACTQAPVLIVNDETLHVSLTRDKVDTIVEDLQRKGKK